MPDSYRLEVAGVNSYHTIVTNLKGNSTAPVEVKMDLDVQRYLWNEKVGVAEHTGYKLYYKEDFFPFTTLPENWWYYLDLHGEGKAVDFPLKMKPVLSWTLIQYIKEKGKLKKAPRAPVEKLKIHICKRAINSEDDLSKTLPDLKFVDFKMPYLVFSGSHCHYLHSRQ